MSVTQSFIGVLYNNNDHIHNNNTNNSNIDNNTTINTHTTTFRGILRVPDMTLPTYNDAVAIDVILQSQLACDQHARIDSSRRVQWFWRISDVLAVPFSTVDTESIECAYQNPGFMARLTGCVAVQTSFGELSVVFREMKIRGCPEMYDDIIMISILIMSIIIYSLLLIYCFHNMTVF